jgi:hypothetical protein
LEEKKGEKVKISPHAPPLIKERGARKGGVSYQIPLNRF